MDAYLGEKLKNKNKQTKPHKTKLYPLNCSYLYFHLKDSVSENILIQQNKTEEKLIRE